RAVVLEAHPLRRGEGRVLREGEVDAGQQRPHEEQQQADGGGRDEQQRELPVVLPAAPRRGRPRRRCRGGHGYLLSLGVSGERWTWWSRGRRACPARDRGGVRRAR